MRCITEKQNRKIFLQSMQHAMIQFRFSLDEVGDEIARVGPMRGCQALEWPEISGGGGDC